jgi:hypothetical protein
MKLYRASRVELVEQSPPFQEFQRTRRRRSPAKCRIVEVPEEPSHEETWPNWLEALPTTCDYLFRLNRFAKDKQCDRYDRKRIYDLKSRMISLLYRRGYCVSCHLHDRSLPEQPCWKCDGTGEDLDSSNWYDVSCSRCNGSGIYRAARVVRYYCFRFQVNGVYYCWHQPKDTVDFDPVVTDAPRDWDEYREMQTEELQWKQALDLLDFLQWVVEQGENETRVGREAG